MESYDFAAAAQTLRQFTWSEFCDWYIEWAKGSIDTQPTRGVLTHVLGTIVRLLHPIMPFVTDELYRALHGAEVIGTAWPAVDGSSIDAGAEKDFAFLQQIVSALRRFRADHEIAPSIRPTALVDTEHHELLEEHINRVLTLARWGAIQTNAAAPDGPVARIVVPGATIHVPLTGILDADAERARLRKEIDKHEADAGRVRAKLGNADFVAKAPEEVVEQQRERLAETEAAAAHLRDALEELA
jgi:valyl-tRNA synthetase